jgi:RND family efflux transporter MFP subunit
MTKTKLKSKWILLGGIHLFAASLLFAEVAYAENYPATLNWSRRLELSTPVSGVVQEVLVSPGDKVSKEAVLLRLDDAVFKAQLDSAQAILHSSDENLKELQRELQRTTELYNRTLLADHDLQVAKNNLVQAKADKEKARAAVALAKNNLHYSTLHTPFNAWVLSRNAEPGKVIAATLKPETLFVVAEADRMLARIWVGENKLAGLRKDSKATVRVNDQEFAGAIHAIGLEPEQKSTEAPRYPIDIEFSTGDKLFRAGQQATVILP